MRITILGKSPAWQDAEGACSGYLIEHEGTVAVLDMGNGVFGKLRRYVDYVDVDGVVLSHLHADHFLDLIPYAYALHYAPRQQPVPVPPWPGTTTPACPLLHAPKGAGAAFTQITSLWSNDTLIQDAFQMREYEVDDTVEIGPLQFRFCLVPHYMPTFAVDVTAEGAGRFTFSADCAPNDQLVEFARDTDLLLIEATLPRPERTGIRGHITPGEAGDHARRAGAKRCVLTHISDELDHTWARKEGERTFGGHVDVAYEGAQYEV